MPIEDAIIEIVHPKKATICTKVILRLLPFASLLRDRPVNSKPAAENKNSMKNCEFIVIVLPFFVIL